MAFIDILKINFGQNLINDKKTQAVSISLNSLSLFNLDNGGRL